MTARNGSQRLGDRAATGWGWGLAGPRGAWPNLASSEPMGAWPSLPGSGPGSAWVGAAAAAWSRRCRATVSRLIPNSLAIRRIDQFRRCRVRIASLLAMLSRFAMRFLPLLGL